MKRKRTDGGTPPVRQWRMTAGLRPLKRWEFRTASADADDQSAGWYHRPPSRDITAISTHQITRKEEEEEAKMKLLSFFLPFFSCCCIHIFFLLWGGGLFRLQRRRMRRKRRRWGREEVVSPFCIDRLLNLRVCQAPLCICSTWK